MASSATMQGNAVNIGGNGGNYFFINWQLAGQNITGNYSTINWQAYFHYNSADAQLDNGVASLSGTRWSNGGRVYNYSGNFSTRNLHLASGSFNIGHNSDGTKTLSVSGGVSVYGSGRSSGSAAWSLPTIPRNSQVTTNDSGHWTLGTPITIYTNRKSGSFTHTITIRMDNASGTILETINNVGDSVVWTPTAGEITTMQNHIPNSNSLVIYINQYNNQVKADSATAPTTYLTDAEPTFSTFTYKDSSSAASITGNNQVLVAGQSTLEVDIAAANKMVAIKGATATRYDVTYDGTINQVDYSTSAVSTSFTGINTTGTRTILVKAIDSRANSTQASQNVVVYPYQKPSIKTDISRENNFGTATTIQISGQYDLLPIGGVNKNKPTAGTLYYHYKKDSDTSFGSWTGVTFTDNNDGTFTAPDQTISLDNQYAFDFEFKIDDKFGTVTSSNTVGSGKPIMFVDSQNNSVGIGKLPESDNALDVDGKANLTDLTVTGTVDMSGAVVEIFPVGFIYMSVSPTNPSVYFAGTWEAWGTGRVPVGVDTTQTEFATVEQIGGSKTHQHDHLIGVGVNSSRAAINRPNDINNFNLIGDGYLHSMGVFNMSQTAVTVAGGNTEIWGGVTKSSTTLQPYITCYMWKRTA